MGSVAWTSTSKTRAPGSSGSAPCAGPTTRAPGCASTLSWRSSEAARAPRCMPWRHCRECRRGTALPDGSPCERRPLPRALARDGGLAA
eukprot:2418708-Lingulodinium_polyedra.AAC.1